jgi:hypothetical protein
MVVEDLTSTPQPTVAESKTAAPVNTPGTTGAKPLSATASSASVQDLLSPPGKQLYAKFKDLLLQKRTLKRKLKRFDEDFQARTGRLPKKADKEVMRPQYQKYHEVYMLYLIISRFRVRLFLLSSRVDPLSFVADSERNASNQSTHRERARISSR